MFSSRVDGSQLRQIWSLLAELHNLLLHVVVEVGQLQGRSVATREVRIRYELCNVMFSHERVQAGLHLTVRASKPK